MQLSADFAVPPFALDDSPGALLRRRAAALAVALRLGDRGAGALLASRLRKATAEGEAVIAGRGLPVAQAAALAAELRAARRLLAQVAEPVTAGQLHRWMAAPPSLGRAGAGADLFDLDGRGAALERAQLGQLHLLQCQLAGAQLFGADLAGAMLDSCDLTSIDGRASRWRDALVLRGRLQGAALAGADLRGAIFSDCDLRGADLSDVARAQGGGEGGAARSIWIRCDLRNTVWTHRDLAQAHFAGCRLADARELRLGPGGSAVRCEPELAAERDPPQARAAPVARRAVRGGEPTLRDRARVEALARDMCEATERDVAVRRQEEAARARASRRPRAAPTRQLQPRQPPLPSQPARPSSPPR